jgi:HPt (histidine-containing phosphotransfer) domain-containing protein
MESNNASTELLTQDSSRLNVEQAILLLGGDREVFEEVLCEFVKSIPERMALLQSAVKDGDAERMHSAAHSLKGGASAVGAEQVRGLAERLEALGRKGEVGAAVETMHELQAEIDQLNELIQPFARSRGTKDESNTSHSAS